MRVCKSETVSDTCHVRIQEDLVTSGLQDQDFMEGVMR